jgi:hypothetical protein
MPKQKRILGILKRRFFGFGRERTKMDASAHLLLALKEA